MRAAFYAHTPIERVMRWPWHRTVLVWAEAQDLYDESWGKLHRVWYRDHD